MRFSKLKLINSDERNWNGLSSLLQSVVTIADSSHRQSFLLPAASTTPSSLPEFSTPRKLASTLSATRLNNTALLSDLHEKEVALSTRDKIIGELEGRVEELEVEIENGLKELEDSQRKEAEVTRREGLRGLEVQMLKNSLVSSSSPRLSTRTHTSSQATYDTEESLHPSTTSFDAQKSLRLTQLEELLQAYQYEMKELSSSVSHWRGLVERYGGSTTDVERLVEHAEESKREIERIAGGAGESVVKRHLEEILRKNESLSEGLFSQYSPVDQGLCFVECRVIFPQDFASSPTSRVDISRARQRSAHLRTQQRRLQSQHDESAATLDESGFARNGYSSHHVARVTRGEQAVAGEAAATVDGRWGGRCAKYQFRESTAGEGSGR